MLLSLSVFSSWSEVEGDRDCTGVVVPRWRLADALRRLLAVRLLVADW